MEPRELVIRCGLLNVRSLGSKSLLINDLITETRCDVFCLSETWLQEGEYVSLNEATPPGYRQEKFICRAYFMYKTIQSALHKTLKASQKKKKH